VRTPGEVAAAGQLACLIEAGSPKPGNVSPGRHFHDTRYEDFVASAVAIGPALAAAGRQSVGSTVLHAVTATSEWTTSNTNLGIILLLAPLARAALHAHGTLRDEVREVLVATTVADAVEVYDAIRLARPGGLGSSASEDVSAAPTVTLREAMVLAATRDNVAREYATDFATTFEIGVPALRSARSAGLGWTEAAVETFLRLLATLPDTLIARKLGAAAAAAVSRRAREVEDAGGVRSEAGREALEAFDDELRSPNNAYNPGTTADLTCAALFVVILEDGWHP
jgi:triphosphoribosyl-dephospho-CoA synthase